MILELAVGASLGIGVYNYFTNASFKSKVTNDFVDLEGKVPAFVSGVKSEVKKL